MRSSNPFLVEIRKAFATVYLADDVGFSGERNCLKNFIGWRDGLSLWRNVTRSFVVTIWNGIGLLSKWLIYIVKFGTELVPIILIFLFNAISELANARMQKKNNIFIFYLIKLTYVLSISFYYFFNMFYFIGFAITSPTKSFYAAYQKGIKLNSKRVSMILAALSGIVTAMSVIIISPIVWKFVASFVVPVMTNHLPVIFSRWLTSVASFMSPVIAPLTKARRLFGKFLKPGISPALRSLSFAIMKRLTELSFIISLGLAAIKTNFSRVKNKIATEQQNKHALPVASLNKAIAEFNHFVLDEQMTICLHPTFVELNKLHASRFQVQSDNKN